MTKILTAAVLTATALSMSACGGGQSGPSAAQRHDATATRSISRQLVASTGKGTDLLSQFPIKKKSADCVASGLVDKIGTKRLQTYGVLDAKYHAKKSISSGIKLRPADAQKATSTVFTCLDVPTAVKKVVASRIATLPAKSRACFNRALNDKNLKPVFEKFFEGDPNGAQQALQAPLAKCAVGSKGQ